MQQASVKSSSGFMISDKSKKVIVDVICYLYVLLFLYTASSKLLDYQNTELGMSKSPIITEFAPILVWLVPLVEIVITVLLLVPKTVITGLYGSFMLMVMFTVYIIYILNFSSFIPCSCGGIIATLTWNQHLTVNIGFILLAITGIILKHK